MEYDDGATFLKYFENIRGRTNRVISCIPRDRIDWRPAEGMFSFADLIRHIAATERHMFAENAQLLPSRYPGHGPELADGYDAVMAYLQQMHTEAVEIFARLSPEAMQMRCTNPGGGSLPVWKWLRGMIEHEAHHRGQIYLMLRMIEVDTPPLYGLTSEQVRARSI